MKVKIGDTVYDASDQPILLLLDKSDKWNILNMEREAVKYCAYPDEGYSDEEIRTWMNEGV